MKETSKYPSWFGSLRLDENNELEDTVLHIKDIQFLAETLKDYIFTKPKMNFTGRNLSEEAIKCGFVNSKEEYYSLLHQVSVKTVKLQLAEMEQSDLKIIQAINALDDIDKSANELSERLAEWYGIHFPEIELFGDELAYFISKHGVRKNIGANDNYFNLAESSMGISFNDEDEDIITEYSSNILSLYATRRKIELYIHEQMDIVAPNLSNIAGYLLGARMISIAGSLEKLAKMPSSTIQVIGANKALFKHLRSKATSPKHGIIFNHPTIKGSSWRHRGKISRSLASTVSIAARVDFYSSETVLNDDLAQQLEAKIKSIKKL
ncbi:rRNA biogenesis protein [Methanosalsum natronophilum]|uniref:rRNA biogenesis protein n=1 Tax=Methanosalsum natronophilum TaxID=768733 RepID=A0A424YMH1_9EURY|nr:MAG: rRNA biogenesis protein [Methanosalsum natronophilum]